MFFYLQIDLQNHEFGVRFDRRVPNGDQITLYRRIKKENKSLKFLRKNFFFENVFL